MSSDSHIDSNIKELKLLRAKYERLIQVSEALLRPWPVLKESDSSQHVNGVAPSSKDAYGSSDVQSTPEIERIDEILAKAQKVRIAPLANPKQQPTYQRSLKQAHSVYGSSHKIGKAKQAKKELKKIPSTETAVDTSKHDTSIKNVHEDTPTIKHIDATKHMHTGKHVETSSCEAITRDSDSFTLQKNGKSLVLPKRYLRLKKIITECDIDVENCDKRDAVFLKKLSVSTEDSEKNETHIELCLLMKELEIVKDELTTTQDLITRCHSEQDVAKLKSKLKFLVASADKLCSASPQTPHQSSHTETSKSKLSMNIEHIKAAIDNEFLSICTEYLVPCLQTLEPTDEKFPILVQCIQKIAGLKKTIFVSLEQDKK